MASKNGLCAPKILVAFPADCTELIDNSKRTSPATIFFDVVLLATWKLFAADYIQVFLILTSCCTHQFIYYSFYQSKIYQIFHCI